MAWEFSTQLTDLSHLSHFQNLCDNGAKMHPRQNTALSIDSLHSDRKLVP